MTLTYQKYSVFKADIVLSHNLIRRENCLVIITPEFPSERDPSFLVS